MTRLVRVVEMDEDRDGYDMDMDMNIDMIIRRLR